MTTPQTTGGSSEPIQPAQSHQQALNHEQTPGFPQPPTGAATPNKPKKARNVVGLIALIAAVVGFIFACIPGALIVGWVLLPIAFVLGLVSLFLKDKSKWMGITALILSIVGTIVGFTVFFAVVADSFEDEFGSGDTNVTVEESEDAAAGDAAAEEETAAAEETASEQGTRENPVAIGSTIENDEWRIVVNSVALAATDAVLGANEFNEPPAEGSEYIVVNYSATYLGDDSEGALPAFVGLEYVTAEGTTVDGTESLAVAPDPVFDSVGTLYTDGTATGNKVFEVTSASAGEGVLAIRPGMFADKVFVAVQ
ncbi:hypothetical protein ACFDTO_17415 [Microbacteriaceae bacterium 4G12]